MSKSAMRRHQQQRYMRRRLATPAWSWVERSPDLSDDGRAALRARAARHSVPCSCPMCGHVRESEGPTVQELKAARIEDWTDSSADQLYDEWTDEDWLAMGLILMGQMYEREEQA